MRTFILIPLLLLSSCLGVVRTLNSINSTIGDSAPFMEPFYPTEILSAELVHDPVTGEFLRVLIQNKGNRIVESYTLQAQYFRDGVLNEDLFQKGIGEFSTEHDLDPGVKDVVSTRAPDGSDGVRVRVLEVKFYDSKGPKRGACNPIAENCNDSFVCKYSGRKYKRNCSPPFLAKTERTKIFSGRLAEKNGG